MKALNRVVCTSEGLMNPASDPGAAPETRRLLEYFYAISGLRTLSGQHCLYWQWANANEPPIVEPDQHVFNTIGKIPAVFATDFGDGQDASHLQKTIALIKQQADSGRIITVSYHFPGTRGDLAKVVDPANTTVRPAFFARVEELVTLLRTLDVNGARVPVIFRPLHEMNAPWPIIWWGKDGAANLQTLWKEIWNRFHNRANPAENLHNVLWMFSANAWLDPETPSMRRRHTIQATPSSTCSVSTCTSRRTTRGNSSTTTISACSARIDQSPSRSLGVFRISPAFARRDRRTGSIGSRGLTGTAPPRRMATCPTTRRRGIRQSSTSRASSGAIRIFTCAMSQPIA